MKSTLAIARKELTVYFTTPLAWVMFAVLTFVGSIFFLFYLSRFQQISLQMMQMQQSGGLQNLNLTDMVVGPVIGSLAVILLFVVPFLSMRLMAEERNRGTLELLLTSPVRPWELVAGKYLAALGVLATALVLTLAYPLLLSIFGTGESGAIEWTTVLNGYLGLFLFGAGFMAVGMFISSITDSQAVAALVTLVFGLLMWLMSMQAPHMEGTAKDVFMYLSAIQHLTPFIWGLLDLEGIAYFASYVIVGLFLTHRAIEGHRWAS